jgi:rRNA maturation protein Nop10
MCAQHQDHKPSLILSIIKSKCTRCRRGDMFVYKNPYHLKYTMKMHDHCPVCGQPLDLEPGFYYGTNMISYALAVVICIFTFFLWWAVIGFSLSDSRFFWWIGVNAFLLIALQPPLMRIARTAWLAFFVKYSPRWKEGDVVERYSVNKEQSANW